MKTELLVIVLLSIVFLFIVCGSPVFVFSSPSSVGPSSLALTSNFNNHQSLQSLPIANAGPNQVVTAGSTVILNGSNSKSSNGIILSYSWKQIPTDAQTTLSGANTPVWEFIAPKVTADTLLRFQLNVTDNLGQTGSAIVNVLDKPTSASTVSLPTKISQSTSAQLSARTNTSNNNNVTNTMSLPSIHTKLFMVRIISPTKGQQIPAHSGLTVSGISVANSTASYCDVSVIVNGIKPYQMAVATGKGGANDYSTWSYKLASTSTVIKQGQNRITAKFSCANNPSLTSYSSVNVIGLANGNNNSSAAVIASSPQHVSLPNNINSKLPSISLGLTKNPIHAGDEETLKIRLHDASNPNQTISGASITGIVADSSDNTTMNFNGVTGSSGTFTYTWIIGNNSKPGLFTVSVLASATGYKSQLIPTKATFKVDPATVEDLSLLQRKTFNCRLFIYTPGPCA